MTTMVNCDLSCCRDCKLSNSDLGNGLGGADDVDDEDAVAVEGAGCVVAVVLDLIADFS